MKKEIEIKIKEISLKGILQIPTNAKGIVLFAHGSGSGRFSPRNQFVAEYLNKRGFATLLLDLLTEEEEKIDDITAELRFDIIFLANRLIQVTKWIEKNKETCKLNINYFGASTGAGAALIATAKYPNKIKAIVSRGGRPDLANKFLGDVKAPTLLIIGGDDSEVIMLNKEAYQKLKCKKSMEIIPGATHLFEEPGTLEQVAKLAANWFENNSK